MASAHCSPQTDTIIPEDPFPVTGSSRTCSGAFAPADFIRIFGPFSIAWRGHNCAAGGCPS